jgi:hypothetical protein
MLQCRERANERDQRTARDRWHDYEILPAD